MAAAFSHNTPTTVVVSSQSGIRGEVYPAHAGIQLGIINSAGNLLSRVTPAADGSFVVDIAPGNYQIVLLSAAGRDLQLVTPVYVDVSRGKYARVYVSLM